jgi:hypothetical protein
MHVIEKKKPPIIHQRTDAGKSTYVMTKSAAPIPVVGFKALLPMPSPVDRIIQDSAQTAWTYQEAKQKLSAVAVGGGQSVYSESNSSASERAEDPFALRREETISEITIQLTMKNEKPPIIHQRTVSDAKIVKAAKAVIPTTVPMCAAGVPLKSLPFIPSLLLVDHQTATTSCCPASGPSSTPARATTSSLQTAVYKAVKTSPCALRFHVAVEEGLRLRWRGRVSHLRFQ